jgi:membrane-associated protease RseP (regulator of RpoE activity)
MNMMMRRQVIIPAILFLITWITTLAAGAMQQGVDPIHSPSAILQGFPFAATLLSILLTHEMAHYLASVRHGVQVTLPFFIPAPSFIGTFGAFIRTRSPILNKRALFDIGVSGPLAGFVVAIGAVWVGLHLSKVIETMPPEGISLGSSLLFSFLSWMVVGTLPEHSDILLHPVAFAGWIGLFITAMNLLPIGQLDGGHIAYAVFGQKHRLISKLAVVSLVGFGLLGWPGWFVWAGLTFILGLGHPPMVDEAVPLDPVRRKIGWFALAVLLLTFIPIPFSGL